MARGRWVGQRRRWVTWAGLAGFTAVAVLVVAAVSVAGDLAVRGSSPSGAATRGPSPEGSASPGRGLPGELPTGLVLPSDVPDPAIVVDDGRYLAFSTASGGLNVPVRASVDLSGWSAPSDALPALPSWSSAEPVWAPAVVERAGGGYLLAYAARHEESGQMCVSIAVAEDPMGPYADDSSAPLVCDHELGGSIDPSFFVDVDGTTWFMWKAEGVAGVAPSQLFSQRLDTATLALVGERSVMVGQDLGWEYPTVENPAMARIDGAYVLLYSANRWDTSSYTTGWATCEGPAGPCVKADTAMLTNDGDRFGPGGASWFVNPDGDLRIAYHGWEDGIVGYPWGRRALYVAAPAWDGSTLSAA